MVTISKYYSSVTKTGVKPSNPGNVVTVIPDVLNPPDSPVNHSPVTIGSPANGLSLVGQELSLNPNDIGAVTITGTQTITGAKTFDNSLLVLSGTSPIFRIASNGNVSTLNFRANNNEEKATLEFNDLTKTFTVKTNVSNSDIAITPHGTGKIKLSNVPSGSGTVLAIDASNNLVKSSGYLKQVIGSVNTNAVVLEPASGSFGVIVFRINQIQYSYIGTMVFVTFVLQTNSFAVGTASGEVKLRIDSTLDLIINAGAGAKQINEFQYGAGFLGDGLFNTVPVRCEILPQAGLSSYFSIKKNAGALNYLNDENPFQASDFKVHASGVENSIIVKSILYYS